jgi:hypothetical protein
VTASAVGRDPLAGVSAEIEGVLASIDALRDAALQVAAGAAGRELCRADLAALQAPIAGLLRRHEGFAAGAGIVAAPGVLADAERWLEWWWADRGSGFEQLRVDLDADSAEFYDYTTTEWYREPERTGQTAVAGPYVDYICTHEYTFTLSVPLVHRGRFLGVAAADVLAEEVERAVLPELARRDRVTVLVSGNGRVIASNDSAFAPGVVLARQDGADALVPAATVAGLPWTLLERRV